jgi:hypothetical protein
LIISLAWWNYIIVDMGYEDHHIQRAERLAAGALEDTALLTRLVNGTIQMQTLQVS